MASVRARVSYLRLCMYTLWLWAYVSICIVCARSVCIWNCGCLCANVYFVLSRDPHWGSWQIHTDWSDVRLLLWSIVSSYPLELPDLTPLIDVNCLCQIRCDKYPVDSVAYWLLFRHIRALQAIAPIKSDNMFRWILHRWNLLFLMGIVITFTPI